MRRTHACSGHVQILHPNGEDEEKACLGHFLSSDVFLEGVESEFFCVGFMPLADLDCLLKVSFSCERHSSQVLRLHSYLMYLNALTIVSHQLVEVAWICCSPVESV